LRVLFVHRDADEIDSCVQELKKAEFAVQANIVLTLSQCVEELRTHLYDLILAEYPSPNWNGTPALQALLQTTLSVPLILLATNQRKELTTPALAASGAYDLIERDRMSLLPMAVRRALDENDLRKQLAEAQKTCLRLESHYRALAENPIYGICRLSADGKFASVNRSFLRMLGYASQEEFLGADLAKDISGAPADRVEWLERLRHGGQAESLELDCRRKDGAAARIRLSGAGVLTHAGEFHGFELIVEDVTQQYALEIRLRQQAECDSLTGLANHRHLFEILHSELSRSKRTGREFSLVLLDLDQFKKINDQRGHLVGDRALVRLSNVLRNCSRSIDTAARQGGDEFALVLPETGAAEASLVARRINELLVKDAEIPSLSVSMGVAAFPGDAQTIGTLMYAADTALYAMKGGRIQYVSMGLAPNPNCNFDSHEPTESAQNKHEQESRSPRV
jgi:diguanylate cyclase (GGDEF)-like protein/PAS domain S-box-containing protein